MNWVLSFHFTFAVFYATRADFLSPEWIRVERDGEFDEWQLFLKLRYLQRGMGKKKSCTADHNSLVFYCQTFVIAAAQGPYNNNLISGAINCNKSLIIKAQLLCTWVKCSDHSPRHCCLWNLCQKEKEWVELMTGADRGDISWTGFYFNVLN